jgi:glutamine---fructose-6-phosphate transaminase (isomerizing)
MAVPALPLLENIRAQPGALAQVLVHHTGPGSPALEEAARAIRARRKVMFCAIGASYCASVPAATLLGGGGIEATVVDAAELLHFTHPMIERGSVVVLVSRSGESVEITRLLPVLQARGATVIGVTNEAGSQLAREADVAILIGSPPDQMVAVQSYVGTLATLHMLGMAVLDQMDDRCRAGMEAVTAAMAEAIPRWEEESQRWRAFLQDSRPLYLLARGYSLASALEGALLFHEVAKAPAIAMGAGAFRHGFIEAVDKEFRGLLLTAGGQTRELDIALAREIAGLRGAIRLVGPPAQDGGAQGLDWWEIPVTDPTLAPILEIVPLQFAAYHLAEWRGIAPGSFRVLQQVVRSETAFR